MSKRRYRKTIVCTFCKKRKVRCDKGNPCSTCIKYGSDNCEYLEDFEAPPSKTSSGNENVNQLLKEEIGNMSSKIAQLENMIQASSSRNEQSEKSPPLQSKNNRLNPHKQAFVVDRGNTDLKYYGILSWLSLLKTDSTLRALWAQFKSLSSKPENWDVWKKDDRLDAMSSNSETFSAYSEKASYGYDDNSGSNVSIGTNSPVEFMQVPSSTSDTLVQNIEAFLPPADVVGNLVNRYFTGVYVFIPFVDEMHLRKKLTRLFHVNNNKITVVVKKENDYAILGILLIIIRFSYMSCFNAYPTSNEPLSQCFVGMGVNYCIGPEAVKIAHMCLDRFNLFKSLNLSVLQLAFLINVYLVYCPESSEDFDDVNIQVYTGMLIQIAYAMGIHREPDNLPGQTTNPRIENLNRKIWYYILVLDTKNAMSLGRPLMVEHNSFDVKRPYYKTGVANVENTAIERIAINWFKWFDFTSPYVRQILCSVTNVRDGMDIRELLVLIRQDDTKPTNLDDIALTENLADDMVSLKIMFWKTHFTLAIFFHIYNHYSNDGEHLEAFDIMKQIFTLIVDHLPIYISVLVNESLLTGTDLFIIPNFELMLHKSFVLLLSFFIRFKSASIALDVSSSNFEHSKKGHYSKLVSLIKGYLNIIHMTLKKLSPRYYFAKNVSQAQIVMFKLTTSKGFRDKLDFLECAKSVDYPEQMLNILVEVLETPLADSKLDSNLKTALFNHSMFDDNPMPSMRTPESSFSPNNKHFDGKFKDSPTDVFGGIDSQNFVEPDYSLFDESNLQKISPEELSFLISLDTNPYFNQFTG